MKLKHFAAIFVFLTSFMLSVTVVGLPVREGCKLVPLTKETQPRRENADVKERLLNFLEADRLTGIELSEDLTNFRSNSDSFTVEKTATSKLLKKMQKVECQNLPADFCAAWDDHRNAWLNKNNFLQQADRYENQGEAYLKYEREINTTYFKMLGVAQKYGAYFGY
jgi:hypothetical protein